MLKTYHGKMQQLVFRVRELNMNPLWISYVLVVDHVLDGNFVNAESELYVGEGSFVDLRRYNEGSTSKRLDVSVLSS